MLPAGVPLAEAPSLPFVYVESGEAGEEVSLESGISLTLSLEGPILPT